MTQELPPAKALAILMHDVSRLIRRRVDRAAQTIGLTSAQWRVLAYLARCEGTNQVNLADHMDMEPITLSRHLDRMQGADMIERRPDPNDRRAYRLFLTDRGRALMERFRGATTSVIADVTEDVTEAEIATAIDILTRLRGTLTGKPAEAPSLFPNLPDVPEKVYAR